MPHRRDNPQCRPKHVQYRVCHIQLHTCQQRRYYLQTGRLFQWMDKHARAAYHYLHQFECRHLHIAHQAGRKRRKPLSASTAHHSCIAAVLQNNTCLLHIYYHNGSGSVVSDTRLQIKNQTTRIFEIRTETYSGCRSAEPIQIALLHQHLAWVPHSSDSYCGSGRNLAAITELHTCHLQQDIGHL